MHKLLNRLTGAALIAGAIVSAAFPAVAATQRESLRPLAQAIVNVVTNDQMQSSIAMGSFPADGRLDNANAGPGVAEDLKSLLEELKVAVNSNSSLSLQGTIHKVADPKNSKLVMIKIKATITNGQADTIANLPLEIRDTGLIGGILGVNSSLPALATREKRNEALQQALKEPSYYQHGALIKSRRESPYGIELLVTSLSAAPKDAAGWARVPARAVVRRRGLPFVQINTDEVYAIRIHNRQPDRLDAAATVSIDGIDCFNFSQIRNPASNRPKYTHYIIHPGVGMVTGWHRTNNESDSFLVTQYGKGAAGRINADRSKVGVITVQFAIAWSGDAVPDAEKGARDGGNETGFGPPTRTGVAEVERHVGVVRDEISVRYTRN
jgi:hypothetical protein